MPTREEDMKPLWRMLAMRRWVDKKDGGRRRMARRIRGELSEPTGEEGPRARRRKNSFSAMDCHRVVPEDMSFSVPLCPVAGAPDGGEPPSLAASPVDLGELRMMVGTWNVAGKSPNVYDDVRLREWFSLNTSSQVADIYVIGFQEVVPLNTKNVIGSGGNGASSTWVSLIGRTLNGLATLPSYEDDEEGSENFSKADVWSEMAATRRRSRSRFCLVSAKQMVGVFLSVWIRQDVFPLVGNLKMSCVRRGVFGCLRNKGSISISMTLNEKTFCFVCSHLASGQKAGDAVKRNIDVSEILKRTRFSNAGGSVPGQPTSPVCILDHDNIVWLGDLNYRLVLCGCENTKELIMKGEWKKLLKNDQLRVEQTKGRVFEGWEEGEICFPPTYKYLMNSDFYVIQNDKIKGKGRVPAWCDRILWRGKGLKQVHYTRGECSFSDHRPVSALFSVRL